jgi:hypothetical protein
MLTTNEIIIRLLLGTLFGGVIGFERQVHGRPAGFRTHILVCIAAVLIMLVSEYYQYLSSIDPSYIRIDPGRIAAGALAGVGFIGCSIKSGSVDTRSYHRCVYLGSVRHGACGRQRALSCRCRHLPHHNIFTCFIEGSREKNA